MTLTKQLRHAAAVSSRFSEEDRALIRKAAGEIDRLNGVPDPTEEKAITVPLEYSELKLTVGRDGVWLHFSASTGRSASMSVNSMAAKQGNLIGHALRDWCEDMADVAEKSQLRETPLVPCEAS